MIVYPDGTWYVTGLGSGNYVVTVVTQVVVEESDPAFKNPTKPVGPIYDEHDAAAAVPKEPAGAPVLDGSMTIGEFNEAHEAALDDTHYTTLGGFLFGYDTAVIAGAIGFLQTHFDLDATMKGWASSCVLIVRSANSIRTASCCMRS